MRIVVPTIALATLLGCAHTTRIPEQLRSSAEHPLKTLQVAIIAPCEAYRSTWDIQFGSKDGKYICLIPTKVGRPRAATDLADVPVGTAVVVKRATFWTGIDSDGYVFDAIVPSYSTTRRVLIDDLDTGDLFNVSTEALRARPGR